MAALSSKCPSRYEQSAAFFYSGCQNNVPIKTINLFGYGCVCDPQKQLYALRQRRHIRIHGNSAAAVNRRPRSLL